MKKVPIDKDLLTDLYITQNLPKRKIAELLNVSIKVVGTRISEYHLTKSQSDVLRSGWDNLSKEDYDKRCNSLSLGNIEYYKNNPDQSERNLHIKESHLNYSDEKKLEIKEKYTCTMFETYGVKHNWQLEKNKDIILLSRGLNWEEFIEKYGNEEFDNQLNRLGIEENPQFEIQRKTSDTKRENNSFSSSCGESILYEWLCDKYSQENVKRWYNKDKRYPFHCDFYIVGEDLFIELQGNWTHGPHPFDENSEEDLQLVEKWRTKSKEINFEGVPKGYYNDAIEVWTVSDPNKRKVARDNNLKYIEIYKLHADLESTLSEAYKL